MKRIRQYSFLLTSIFSITASSLVFAVPSMPKGVYIDGDYGFTGMSGKSYPGSSSTSSSGKGWSGTLGYKFNPYAGIESSYTRYADTRIKNSQTITAARDMRYAADVAGKFTVPFANSGLEPFVKLGLVWLHSKIGKVDPNASAVNNLTFDTGTKTNVGLYWGVGAQYYFSENISAHIQYNKAQGSSSTGSVYLASIGLSVLF